MAEVKQLERVFVFNNKELKDIDPTFSPVKVKKVYSNQYPELNNATISGPEIKGNKAVYTFEAKVGTLG